MPRYLLSVFAPTTPTELGPYPSREVMDAALEDTAAFNARLEREGRLVLADGLAPAPAAMTVDGQGDTPLATAGPYLETTEQIGGFWVVDADDLETAVQLAGEASAACRGVVEVRPFHSLPAADGS